MTNSRPCRVFLAFLLCGMLAVAVAPVSLADTTPQAKDEINFLLAYLESSGCTFDRNGSQYDGAHAAAHLRDKFRALDGRGMISSAEDFIENAATRSSISGREYTVTCGAASPTPTREWLRAALLLHRKAPAR